VDEANLPHSEIDSANLRSVILWLLHAAIMHAIGHPRIASSLPDSQFRDSLFDFSTVSSSRGFCAGRWRQPPPMVEAAAPMEAAAPPPLPGKEILRGVLTALPGEDGSPPGATRATDAQYVAMSWRLAREFKLRGSGLLSRLQPPMTEGYRADGPLSQLRVPDLAAHPGAGEEAQQWLLRYWKNPGAAKWLAKADTTDRTTRLSGALGLPHRSQ
jgi:hypothetical protein